MYDPATKSVARMEAAGRSAARVFGLGRRQGQGLADRLVGQCDRPLRPGNEKFDSFPSNRDDAGVRQMLGRDGEAWGAESGNDRLVMVPAR